MASQIHYDTYEGRYGIEDVKQSLYRLNSVGINSYAFAIEANAKYYLPKMFGQTITKFYPQISLFLVKNSLKN